MCWQAGLQLAFSWNFHNKYYLGPTNTSLTAVKTSKDGRTLVDGSGSITWSCVESNLIKVDVKSNAAVVGARFLGAKTDSG